MLRPMTPVPIQPTVGLFVSVITRVCSENQLDSNPLPRRKREPRHIAPAASIDLPAPASAGYRIRALRDLRNGRGEPPHLNPIPAA